MATEVTTEAQAQQQAQQPQHKKSRLFMVLFAVAAALVIVGLITVLQRRSQYDALAKETEKLAIPTVAVIHPTTEPPQEDLVLPSTLQAYVESPIYARTTGYLQKWYHDIGSRVRQGELLADIDTPEVDQQLMQARADLNTARANEKLSEITATRYQELIKTDGVSKQEVDNAVGDYAAKVASVASAEANVHRLEDLESFKHVYAPFTGVITRRTIDIGNLITAAGQQLFYMAQTDPIRAYVSVPEMYAPAVHKGLGAYFELSQYPGERFQGQVVRSADAIDQASRTLNTEVDVPNKDGRLLPGGYAQVHLLVGVAATRLQVPVNALLFRAEGLRAVVVDQNHKTHLQKLLIGRDYGTALEVLQGLNASDWIVLNPPDSIDEGMDVNVKVAPQPAGPATKTGSAPPSDNTPPTSNGGPPAQKARH